MINSLLTNLNELKQDFGKLYKNSEENDMTNKKAYFQGGGGVNEPTPGKPRYAPMGDADYIRDHEDKQMVGDMDTGPVAGLYPGDAEEKRELQRMAAQEQRALRRHAALEKAKENLAKQKQAYFQGGGGVNEPQVLSCRSIRKRGH